MFEHPSVCLLNDSFPPLIDGVANTVVSYARWLPEHGFNPVVVTPAHPDAQDSRFSYPVIRYPSIDLRNWMGYLAGVPFSPELLRQLQDRKVSVLHTHCPIASTLLARQLRAVLDAPLILTYHTKFDIDIASILRSKALQEGSKRALVENITACDEIWAVSQGAGDNLRSIGYQGDYVVMPNGVDMPLGRVSEQQCQAACRGWDLPLGVPVFLFVGRIRWYKGLKIILDALAMLKASGKDFRMVFIGDGTDRAEVERTAQELGLNSVCFFTGAISDRETLRAWYCRSDLFLFPSTFDTNGLVVREAAACSLASVLVAGSCAAEGVTHGRNGFLIEENAPSLFALLKDLTGRREEMRRVGVIAGKELYLSWADAVKLAAQRYEIVIDRYRRGKYPRGRKPMDHVLGHSGELMEDLAKAQDRLREIESHMHSRME